MRNLSIKFHYFFWILVPVVSLALLIGFTTNTTVEPSPSDDLEELDALIDEFQEAYSNERLSDLRHLFYADAVIATDSGDGNRQRVHSLEDWLQGTQENVFDENDYISDVLTNREIQVFRNIAYAVCDYTYTCDTKIGRGVDIFTFLKMRDNWKIISLQFTGDEVTRN